MAKLKNISQERETVLEKFFNTHQNKVLFVSLRGQGGRLHTDIKLCEVPGFPNRAYRALKATGVNTFMELLNMSYQHLECLKGVGETTIKQIKEIAHSLCVINFKVVHVEVVRVEHQDIDKHTNRLLQMLSQIFKDSTLSRNWESCKACLKQAVYEQIAEGSSKDVDIDRALMQKNVISSVQHAILHKLQSTFEPQTIKQLYAHCDHSTYMYLDFLFTDMEKEGLIQVDKQKTAEKEEYKYSIKGPSVLTYVENLEDKQAKAYLELRLQGYSLQKIGDKYNRSREWIRQKTTQAVRKMPKCTEDRYANLFQKYNVKLDDFVYITKAPEHTYHYLNMAYKKGKASLCDARVDKQIPKAIRERIFDLLDEPHTFVDAHVVISTKTELITYLTNKYCKEPMDTKKFRKLCNDIGRKNGFSTISPEQLRYVMLAEPTIMYTPNYNGYPSSVRYYNPSNLKGKDLVKLLRLKQYNNIEITTRKLFRENEQVMKQIDIHNEYELHNLLRKQDKCKLPSNMRLVKMPTIHFGVVDRKQQFLNVLHSTGPLNYTDFARECEERFGHHAPTITNYIVSVLKSYKKGSKYYPELQEQTA